MPRELVILASLGYSAGSLSKACEELWAMGGPPRFFSGVRGPVTSQAQVLF